MKISKLQLKNIGVFDDVTFDFYEEGPKDCAEIHIFTGENGTGKSTILYALSGLFSTENHRIIENQSQEQLRKRMRFFNGNENNRKDFNGNKISTSDISSKV